MKKGKRIVSLFNFITKVIKEYLQLSCHRWELVVMDRTSKEYKQKPGRH